MSVDISHQRILASAGSGKTYQLTSRYLRLLAHGAKPESILASTFTRLAAGQIRDKVLFRLAEAVKGDEKRDTLAGDIGVDTLSKAEVLKHLRLLTRSLHRLQIRTLDSFFGSIVRGYALELGVPLGCEVMEQGRATPLRYEAMRLMLDERDPQKLIDLLRMLTMGDTNRSVISSIDDTVKQLYELYREAKHEAWECIPQPPGRLKQPELAEAIGRLEAYEFFSDKRFSKAQSSDIQDARLQNWKNFLDSGLASKIACGETTYYSREIPPEAIAIYKPLVAHALAEMIGRVRDQTIATRNLLAMYGSHYEDQKRRRRVLTFQDLVATLARAQRFDGLSDIAYRIDASIEHLLFDEFQDTSVIQWHVLEPMVRELVSDETSGRTFFCVGDLKQSIYGWRDATPEILEQVPELLLGEAGDEAIESKTLAKSWRSSPAVIDTVNEVFQNLRDNGSLKDHADVAEHWSGMFQTHETVRQELPGYSELRTVERVDDDSTVSQKNLRLYMAAELVQTLHREAPSAHIGVLTRKGETVNQLLYQFGPTQLNLLASGPGGGSLTDATPVNAILDLLRLADHPDDTISAFHVVNSPARQLVGLDGSHPAPDDAWSMPPREVLHRIAGEVRSQLLNHGYARTLAEWVEQLAAQCDGRQLERMAHLAELAELYDRNATLRPSDFVEYVESTKAARSQPAQIEAMTVHAAKGLEFDIVVLPELDSALTGSVSPDVVYERQVPAGPITRIARYISQDLREQSGQIQPLFEQHTYRTVRESLCLLYVAMTRAKQGLYMLIDPPGMTRSGPSKTIPKTDEGVLRCVLGERYPEPGQVIFSRGDQSWLSEFKAKEPEVQGRVKLSEPIALQTSRRGRRGLIAPAASVGDEPAQLDFSLQRSDNNARDRGLILHALVEQIEWLEDFDLDDQALFDIAAGLAPRRDREWINNLCAEFRTMLKEPAIASVLSRGSQKSDRWSIFREHPFARIIDGKLQRGAIDRIEAEYDANHQCQCTRVIDFKTEAVDPEKADDHARTYRRQLDAYAVVAADFFDIDESKITRTVLFLSAGCVADLIPGSAT